MSSEVSTDHGLFFKKKSIVISIIYKLFNAPIFYVGNN